jgi:hypothetical protein
LHVRDKVFKTCHSTIQAFTVKQQEWSFMKNALFLKSYFICIVWKKCNYYFWLYAYQIPHWCSGWNTAPSACSTPLYWQEFLIPAPTQGDN